ncbi:MAG: class I SAM-dependent methyltransferase [Calditrichota bacterium]
MVENHYKYPVTGINKYVIRYIRSLPNLTDRTVVDIPCGDGRASHEFIGKGANVKALDLYPEFLQINNLKAQFADMTESFPVSSGFADYLICQEGIEHLHDKLTTFIEFNRVLRRQGILLITTPNLSNVRSRISWMFLESDFWKRIAATEIDSVWFSKKNTDKMYFGHLFLTGVNHLQTIASITGFTTRRRIRTDISPTSLIAGIILYPMFIIMTVLAWLIYRNENLHVSRKERDRILWDRLKLNLSPTTLFCKHIFWELQKDYESDEIIAKLIVMSRD